MTPQEKPKGTFELSRDLVKPLHNQDTALVQDEVHLRAYLEAALRAIVAVSAEGRIVFMNGHTEEIFGYTRTELVGQDIKLLLPERFHAACGAALAAYFADPSVQVLGRDLDLAGRRKSGAEFPIEIGLSFVQAQEGVIALGFVSDTTERQRIRDELAYTHAELLRSNTELEQFAQMASHDLQEPLRNITSYLQLLERRYQGKLDAEADELINCSMDGAARMKRLIEDLLKFSGVGTQPRKCQSVPADLVVRDAVNGLHEAIQARSAEVTWDHPLPTIAADPTLLVQVFQNLIGNGIKFQNNGRPRVHICATEKESESVFSVRDNGIGIAPQDSGRIFQIFQRLHTADEYPGTGIGLAIARRIVERHGGRIWVESKPGEGATFSFSIPRQLASQQ
jgi:PAS domain S-box-containing protein